MKLSEAIEKAIADAAQRCCVGTLPPEALAEGYRRDVELALTAGEAEPDIIEKLNNLKP